MRFLLVFIILNFSFLQKEGPVQNSASVVLQSGERAMVGPFLIEFREVLSDSRCPKGVACIWAGEAKVLMAVYRDNKFLGVEILTLSNSGSEISRLGEYFSGISLSLAVRALKPYPEIDEKIPLEDYSLSLQFTEKEAKKND